jgi:DNA uptake protein ComE-like DNA-binding protein
MESIWGSRIVKRAAGLLSDYLTYSRSEQRGVIVLSLLLAVLFIIKTAIPSSAPTREYDTAEFWASVDSFETALNKAQQSKNARFNKPSGGLNSGPYTRLRDDTISYKSLKMNFSKQSKGYPIVELNAADTFDLQQLRGIGPAFARRIVMYRERIRGFCDKSQLLEVYGMDTVRYRLISGQITVNSDSIRPFDINIVSFKELLKHPYFPFDLTKKIMLYRQKIKIFKEVGELKLVEGMNDSLFRRISIYLRVTP